MRKQLKRLEAVKERQSGKYEDAWGAFYDRIWMHLTPSEIEAYTDAIKAPDSDADRWSDVDGLGSDEQSSEAWRSWFVRFLDSMPPDDESDFSKWPDLLPKPPKEPKGVFRACRQLVANGDRIERQVGGYMLAIYAAGRAVRHKPDPFLN